MILVGLFLALKKLVIFLKSKFAYLGQLGKNWLIKRIPLNEREQIFVIINQENIVETVREYYIARLFPWPGNIKQREVLHRTGLYNFSITVYQLLYPHTTPKQIITQLKDCSLKPIKASVTQLPEKIMRPLLDPVKNAINHTVDHLRNDPIATGDLQQALRLIGDTVNSCTSNLKQEWACAIEEAIRNSNPIQTLRDGIISRLRERINQEQKLFRFTNNTPLLPDGTKFVYCHDQLTIIVVEEKPALRTINFEIPFILDKARVYSPPDSPIFKKPREETSFYLSFPYMIFVLAFYNNTLLEFYCFYNNKPLQTLDDMMFLTNLPNTQVNGSVCLHLPVLKEGTPLIRATEQAISYFWQSNFNSDLPDNYFYMAKRDQRLADLGVWEKISQTNSSFWRDVDWWKAEPLRQLIDSLAHRHSCGWTKNLSVYCDQLVDNSIEESLNQTTASMMTSCRMPKVNFDSLVDRKLSLFLTSLTKTITDHLIDKFKEGSVTLDPSLIDLVTEELSTIFNQALSQLLTLHEDELIFRQAITQPALVNALNPVMEEGNHGDR